MGYKRVTQPLNSSAASVHADTTLKPSRSKFGALRTILFRRFMKILLKPMSYDATVLSLGLFPWIIPSILFGLYIPSLGSSGLTGASLTLSASVLAYAAWLAVFIITGALYGLFSFFIIPRCKRLFLSLQKEYLDVLNDS